MMLDQLRSYILEKKYHPLRHPSGIDFAAIYSREKLSPRARVADRFARICRLETPLLMPRERIVFTRTITDLNAILIKEPGKPRIDLPCVYTKEEWQAVKSEHFIHEAGWLSNVVPDFAGILAKGLLAYREQADEHSRTMIDALLDLSDRYAREAERQGRQEVAAVLERVPRYPARTFHEALQMLRIINFAAWLEGNYHVAMGRFDQYCLPYYEADIQAGRLTEGEALELLCDFFLSMNKDTDLYYSVQRGDNGQSITLGGIDETGKDCFNALSRLCIQASREMKVIDPKINIRVNKDTPLEVYELGSTLTAVGLGFPQYTNDDVIIPGLLKKGYDLEDARNYAIAACWEIIVPVVGADIINVGAMSFARAIDRAFHDALPAARDFEEFYAAVREEIREQVREIMVKIKNIWYIPSPLYGLFFPFEDISKGGKYNNLGMHGTGIACAADSLAAIKKYVFEERSITPEDYIRAVDNDYAGEEAFLAKLRYNTPKMGNGDDGVDSLAVRLLADYAAAVEPYRSDRGGCVRAGTGTAMYYLWHAEEVGASPDGRRKGEGLGTNYSPSIYAKCNGPFSIIRSFSRPKLEDVMNGGPLTLEFLSGSFENEESLQKLALLVQAYIRQGGHQLQLNAVDATTLRDAQAHPENYPQLVVRVWGWSAYFVELEKPYQNHVIARTEYAL